MHLADEILAAHGTRFDIKSIDVRMSGASS
jgi:hypothetical protein